MIMNVMIKKQEFQPISFLVDTQASTKHGPVDRSTEMVPRLPRWDPISVRFQTVEQGGSGVPDESHGKMLAHHPPVATTFATPRNRPKSHPEEGDDPKHIFCDQSIGFDGGRRSQTYANPGRGLEVA